MEPGANTQIIQIDLIMIQALTIKRTLKYAYQHIRYLCCDRKNATNNLQSLYSHSKITRTPFFTLDSHHITIIEDPLDFYVTIQKQIKRAAYRIGFSSLYLGTGPLERAMFKNIVKKLEKNQKMDVCMLFDYNRSMREEKGESSIEMMSYYLNEGKIAGKIQIAFNKQSKSMNKVLGEIKGVHHQKIAIFDDTIILGGANLSHNYFLNRKDRYMKFKESPQFSDYLYDYLKTMAENNFALDSATATTIQSQNANLSKHYKLWKFAYEPESYKQTFHEQEQCLLQMKKQKNYEQNRKIVSQPKSTPTKSRNIQLAQELGTEIKPIAIISENEKIEIRENTRDRLFGAGDEDTVNNFLIDIEEIEQENEIMQRGEKVYIFPFVHFPKLQETHEPEVLHEILENSTKNNYPIRVSSGYMNFTNKILQILSKAEAKTKILCSSPMANSFFRAGKFKKYIPYFYRCFQGNILEKWPEKVQIKEFFNGQWSFHAKGIWIKQSQNSYLTVIGSSNFNNRSLKRDTQLQAYLYSTCPKFNQRLDKEWSTMQKNCQEISLPEIKADEQIKYTSISKFFSKIFSKFL